MKETIFPETYVLHIYASYMKPIRNTNSEPGLLVVSRGITSATQRQKFHTDDVKSVRNPVRKADWSTELLRMTYTRQRVTKVKCKRDEVKIGGIYSRGSVWVLLKLIHRWTQHFSKIDQEKRKIEQIWMWTPWLPDILCKHWFMSSVWNFCRWVADVPREITQRRRARRNGCFAGYLDFISLFVLFSQLFFFFS